MYYYKSESVKKIVFDKKFRQENLTTQHRNYKTFHSSLNKLDRLYLERINFLMNVMIRLSGAWHGKLLLSEVSQMLG
jgi:hypothetical protein